MMKNQSVLFLLLLCLAVIAPTHAEQTFVFTSAPRADEDIERATYQPVAEYLSRITGLNIEYRFPDNWLSYQKEMLNQRYDIVFDGPHFASWRMKFTGHEPLIKMDGALVFAVITKKGSGINSMEQLNGRVMCMHAPPNLGTLTATSAFTNPLRQPFIRTIASKGWREGYDEVVRGGCVAAVLPKRNLSEFDPDGTHVEVVKMFPPMPNQVITIGPRFSEEQRNKIRAALLSERGNAALQQINQRFNVKRWLPATQHEYEGYSVLLKDSYQLSAHDNTSSPHEAGLASTALPSRETSSIAGR